MSDVQLMQDSADFVDALYHAGFKEAEIGWKRGTSYSISVPGQPQRVRIRIMNGDAPITLTTAIPQGVPKLGGYPCLVRKEGGVWVAKQFNAALIENFTGSGPLQAAGSHTHDLPYGLPDFVSMRRVLWGRVEPYLDPNTNTYGTVLKVRELFYGHNGEDKRFPDDDTVDYGLIDVADYITTTSGKQNWIKVGINPETNALVAAAGPDVETWSTLTKSGLVAISLAGAMSLAGVKVTYGQAQIIDELKFQALLGAGSVLDSAPTDVIDRIFVSRTSGEVLTSRTSGNVLIRRTV